MTQPESPHAGPMEALRRFLDVPLRAQTYRNLAYLSLAFPLGLAYFVGATIGLSTGIGSLITLVGFPILILTLAGATLVAGFEANLARWLLRIDVSPPAWVDDVNDFTLPRTMDEFVERMGGFLAKPTTWTSLLLVLLKFVFGVIAFVALTVYGVFVAVLVTTPMFYDAPLIVYRVGPYIVDTMTEAAILALGGVLVFFVGLHLLNGLARLYGVVTATLLGQPPEDLANPDTTNDC